MKLIIKKSVAPLPPNTGGIADTLNVTDKVKNAPSINLVQQMTGIPQDGIIQFDGDEIPEGYEEVEKDIINSTNITDKANKTYSAEIIDGKETNINKTINDFKSAIGLGTGYLPIVASPDLDNLNLHGFAYITNGKDSSTTVGAKYGYLLQLIYAGVYKLQIFTDFQDSAKILYRKCVNGTWGSWKTISAS